MARTAKTEKPAETLDEFIARVQAENELPIVAVTFPDTDRDYQTVSCGFRVSSGTAKARLSNGDWVK